MVSEWTKWFFSGILNRECTVEDKETLFLPPRNIVFRECVPKSKNPAHNEQCAIYGFVRESKLKVTSQQEFEFLSHVGICMSENNYILNSRLFPGPLMSRN